MTSSPSASDPDPASPEFARRRAEARATLDASIQPSRRPVADPLRRDWFEQVYRLAENDPARVPGPISRRIL